MATPVHDSLKDIRDYVDSAVESIKKAQDCPVDQVHDNLTDAENELEEALRLIGVADRETDDLEEEIEDLKKS